MMKTAIFDLDGTLANTLYDLADATNYGLAKMGYPIHNYDRYRYFVGNGVQKLCFRALPEDKKDETEKLHGYFDEYYSAHYLDKTVLYSGISELVGRLCENGVRLSIATNKPQVFAVPIAETLFPGIGFAKVLGGCDERAKKPDPAIINEILDAVGRDGNTVYMIGDSDVDINTAKNAEVISIGCTWGFRGREELVEAGADYIAETAEEVGRIILD